MGARAMVDYNKNLLKDDREHATLKERFSTQDSLVNRWYIGRRSQIPDNSLRHLTVADKLVNYLMGFDLHWPCGIRLP